MAVVEITIVPIGEGTSLSKYVAGCQMVLQSYDTLNVEIHAMGTTVEGDLSEILKAYYQMEESVFQQGAQRVYSVLKIDDRRDKISTMKQKIESVEEKLKDMI